MKRTNLRELPTECVGSFVFHVVKDSLSSENHSHLKEDDIRIWSNIEKLVVFKETSWIVVFIGVNGVVCSG